MAARKKKMRKPTLNPSGKPRKPRVCTAAALRRSAMRRKLKHDKPRKTFSPTVAWFENPANAEALDFIEVWLDLASQGKVGSRFLTMTSVLRELVTEYGYPYQDPTGFSRYLQRTYGTKYNQAIDVKWRHR